MSMRYLIVLPVILLAGCEYSLRIPFPRVEKVEQGSIMQSVHPTVKVEPSSPALGEAVTITYSGLEAGFNYSVYLTYGDTGGGDPDKPDPRKFAPYYKLGNLVPVEKVASVSFEVRSMMGNDQNGDPFKLSRGQLVTLMIKGQLVDKPENTFTQSGSGGSFLIQ